MNVIRLIAWMVVAAFLAESDLAFAQNAPMPADVRAIVEYNFGLCAEFLTKCRRVDEGNGTLFDHLLMHFGSDMSEGGGHNGNDIPLLLLGGANGRLRGGRIIDHAGGLISEVNLGILQRAGLRTERFGDVTRGVTL